MLRAQPGLVGVTVPCLSVSQWGFTVLGGVVGKERHGPRSTGAVEPKRRDKTARVCGQGPVRAAEGGGGTQLLPSCVLPRRPPGPGNTTETGRDPAVIRPAVLLGTFSQGPGLCLPWSLHVLACFVVPWSQGSGGFEAGLLSGVRQALGGGGLTMARFGDSHLPSGMAAGPRCPPPPQSGRAVLPMGSWLGEHEPCCAGAGRSPSWEAVVPPAMWTVSGCCG